LNRIEKAKRRRRSREELASTKIAVVDSPAAVPQYETIKIAIDVHAVLLVAARQLDNATPQPPQKFTHDQLLKFIAKQVALARKKMKSKKMRGIAARYGCGAPLRKTPKTHLPVFLSVGGLRKAT
jgi:hypothetical protein